MSRISISEWTTLNLSELMEKKDVMLLLFMIMLYEKNCINIKLLTNVEN